MGTISVIAVGLTSALGLSDSHIFNIGSGDILFALVHAYCYLRRSAWSFKEAAIDHPSPASIQSRVPATNQSQHLPLVAETQIACNCRLHGISKLIFFFFFLNVCKATQLKIWTFNCQQTHNSCIYLTCSLLKTAVVFPPIELFASRHEPKPHKNK